MKQTQFKKINSVKNANADVRVIEMFYEIGNMEYGKKDWWIYLKEGYICRSMGCGTIHEQTAKECLHLLNTDVITIEEFKNQNQ